MLVDFSRNLTYADAGPKQMFLHRTLGQKKLRRSEQPFRLYALLFIISDLARFRSTASHCEAGLILA